MEQEYPTSLGYKIFYGTLAAGAVIGTMLIYKSSSGYYYSNNEYHNNPTGLIFLFIGIIVAGLITVNLIIRKFIISDDSVSYKSVWGLSKLKYEDIKGFRTSKNAISIIPTGTGHRKIFIRDFDSLSQDSDLRKWITDNYKNLDKMDFEEEKDKILQDTSFGITKEERESAFKKYREYNIAYTLGALPLFFIPLFLNTLNSYVSIILLLYPVIGILLMAKSKGLIRLFSNKNSAYAPICLGMFFSSASLIIPVLKNTEIVNFYKLWEPAAIIATMFCATLLYLSLVNAKDNIAGQIILALVIGCLYGLGVAMTINCAFDNSTVHVYPANVKDAYVTHGKSTSYNLVLNECDGFSGSKTTEVNGSFYRRAQIGSTVKIDEKQGSFGAHWFFDWPVWLILWGLYIGGKHNFRNASWLIMVAIGLIGLSGDIFPGFDAWNFIWPAAIIGFGIWLILRRNQPWDEEKWKRKWERKNNKWDQKWDKYDYKYGKWGAADPVVTPVTPYDPANPNPEAAASTNVPPVNPSYQSNSGDDTLDAVSVFGNVVKTIFSKNFRGGDVVNIFGGTELDFTQADINGRVIIDIVQIFGGSKIIVPSNWQVVSDTAAVFAGIDDKRIKAGVIQDPNKILVIKGVSIFAGIDIRSY